jgi:hypothetical protein
MKPEQMEDLLRYRMEQAHETVREAEILLDQSALRGAVNRAYGGGVAGRSSAGGRQVLSLSLAESLFAALVLTIPDAQRRLEISYPGAQQIVRKLLAADILRQVAESSYGKTYVAYEIVEIIRES